nr:DUF4417 domain-containing protein [Caenimonas aquaedulcis]
MDHCTCVDRQACQKVCPNNRHFVARIHEVRGFGYDDIERRRGIPLVQLPTFAHLLFTYPKISNLVQLPVAAIPLSDAFNRSGKGGTALTRSEVDSRFRLAAKTPLILSGVGLDRKIEKFWGVTRGRSELLAGIRALDPLMVTTPNYSVTLDAPRHDAMHSLKRILLSWSELHDAGLRTALHLNAVTDRDYGRMAEFLSAHSEIRAVSVEFETGAAPEEQGVYHAQQLDELVQRIGRPLHLVFRGDARWVPMLQKSFPSITALNGSASIRTRMRRRAVLAGEQLSWASAPTQEGEALDELLAHNLRSVSLWFSAKTIAPVPSRKKAPLEVRPKRHDEARQPGLL